MGNTPKDQDSPEWPQGEEVSAGVSDAYPRAAIIHPTLRPVSLVRDLRHD
jgi:hypothetical protein